MIDDKWRRTDCRPQRAQSGNKPKQRRYAASESEQKSWCCLIRLHVTPQTWQRRGNLSFCSPHSNSWTRCGCEVAQTHKEIKKQGLFRITELDLCYSFLCLNYIYKKEGTNASDCFDLMGLHWNKNWMCLFFSLMASISSDLLANFYRRSLAEEMGQKMRRWWGGAISSGEEIRRREEVILTAARVLSAPLEDVMVVLGLFWRHTCLRFGLIQLSKAWI